MRPLEFDGDDEYDRDRPTVDPMVPGWRPGWTDTDTDTASSTPRRRLAVSATVALLALFAAADTATAFAARLATATQVDRVRSLRSHVALWRRCVVEHELRTRARPRVRRPLLPW